MTISSLIASRLVTGIGALAIAGSLAGGTAVAAKSAKDDNAVRELRHDLRDQTKAEREEIKDLRKQLAAEYAKDSPDEAKMEQLHERIQAKRAAIEGLRFQALLDMHDELDAEQRQRMAERMATKGKHGKGKHGEAERGKDKAGKDKRNKAQREGKPGKAEGKGKGKGKDKVKDKDNKDNKAQRDAAERKGKGGRPA